MDEDRVIHRQCTVDIGQVESFIDLHSEIQVPTIPPTRLGSEHDGSRTRTLTCFL